LSKGGDQFETSFPGVFLLEVVLAPQHYLLWRLLNKFFRSPESASGTWHLLLAKMSLQILPLTPTQSRERLRKEQYRKGRRAFSLL